MEKSRGKKWIFEQSRGSRGQLGIIVVTRLAFVMVNLVMAMVLSQFTEYATGDAEYSLGTLIIIALIMFTIEGIVYVIESICKKSIYSNIEKKIRINMLGHLQNSDILKLQEYHSSELLTRLTKDTEQVSNCLQNLIINIFGGVIMAVAALIYMFVLSWKLSLIIIIAIPILGIFVSIFSPLVQNCSKIDKENEDSNRIQMRELVQNIILSQVYNASELMQKKVNDTYEKKRKSAVKLGGIEGIFSFFNNLTGSIMFLIIMGFGAYLTVNGEFSVGSMIAVINLLNYIVWPFSNISSSISEFNQAVTSANRIMELSQIPEKNEVCVLQDIKNEYQDVRLIVNDMSFSYNEENNIFSHINIQFPKNGVIGIVGRNGCGKSTFLKILLNLYAPQNGNVQYINAKSTAHDSTHIVALVPSNNYIFSGTVKENICMSTNIDLDRMIEASKLANADSFVEQMEHKYDEKIGDGGNSLSSGQAQRIALARAYYYNAQFVVLDEPTSNLDQVSIEKFHNVVKEISRNCLCMIATHDMSTINICDKILLVDESGIREVDLDSVEQLIKQENVESV